MRTFRSMEMKSMPLMKTSNPALGENTFRDVAGIRSASLIDAASRMTLNGTVNKTGLVADSVVEIKPKSVEDVIRVIGGRC